MAVGGQSFSLGGLWIGAVMYNCHGVWSGTLCAQSIFIRHQPLIIVYILIDHTSENIHTEFHFTPLSLFKISIFRWGPISQCQIRVGNSVALNFPNAVLLSDSDSNCFSQMLVFQSIRTLKLDVRRNVVQ